MMTTGPDRNSGAGSARTGTAGSATTGTATRSGAWAAGPGGGRGARPPAPADPRPSRVRPYQRRRWGPVAVVVALLAVLAVGTWVTVLSTASDGFGKGTCPPPLSGPAPGETVERSALYAVAPAPLSKVRVQVRNAGGQRRQANLVAAELSELGFPESAPPDNDTFYPDGNMECVGQLRFGPTGEAAASTMAMVLPCVELIRDARPDDSVEVAVGTAFGDLSPPRPARDALDQLRDTGGGSDGANNADPAAPDAAPLVPSVDPALLAQVRESGC